MKGKDRGNNEVVRAISENGPLVLMSLKQYMTNIKALLTMPLS